MENFFLFAIILILVVAIISSAIFIEFAIDSFIEEIKEI